MTIQAASRFDWRDVVPDDVAWLQEHWERRSLLRRVNKAGVTQHAIGQHIGTTGARVSALTLRARGPSPVERWLSEPHEFTPLERKRIARIQVTRRDRQPEMG